MLSSRTNTIFSNSNDGKYDLFQISDAEDRCNFGSYYSLTYKQRIYGFGIFFVLGLLFSVLGSIMIFIVNLTGFATTYSMGNICMIVATFFLFGPMRQFKNMFSSWQRFASVAIFVLMIVLTLVAALELNNGMLCIIFLVLQVIAYLWYTITSIPGGQTVCKYCCIETFSL
jgi:hypothetical protein